MWYLIFGFGPSTQDSLNQINGPIFLKKAHEYLWPSITALRLYITHGCDIAVALSDCPWEAGVKVSETTLNSVLEGLVSAHGQVSPLNGLAGPNASEINRVSDLCRVIHFILKTWYPGENTKHLLTLSRMLAQTVVHSYAASSSSEELIMYNILRGELLEYVQNK